MFLFSNCWLNYEYKWVTCSALFIYDKRHSWLQQNFTLKKLKQVNHNPKKEAPINIKRGQALSFLLCSLVFSTTQKFFFAEEKEKLKWDWVWRWVLKKKYLVWFSKRREGEEKKEKEEEWLGFETGLHFWLNVRLRLSSLQEQPDDFWITRVYIEEDDHIHIKDSLFDFQGLNLILIKSQEFISKVLWRLCLFVCGCGGIFVTRIVNVVLENLFALSEFTNFHHYLDYETLESDHFFWAYYTL